MRSPDEASIRLRPGYETPAAGHLRGDDETAPVVVTAKESALSSPESALSSPEGPERPLSTGAVDMLGRAEPPSLATKHPMAVSPLAIGERAASFPRSRPRLAACPSCSPAGRAGRAHREACSNGS